MKKIIVAITIGLSTAQAQIVNTGVMDTTDFRYQGKVTVEGYIDAYYAYDFNKPVGGNRPYFVSMARHNEMTINLAFVDVKYSSSRLRARFVPGFGTYINANYAKEPGASGDWQPPKPRRLGWKGLTDAQIKEQAQLTATEAAVPRRRKQ